MEINLINDKRQQTYINLRFKRIRIDDNEKNPLNKLNSLQEKLF